MKVVKIQVEISDPPSQLQQSSLIASILGKSHKIFAHSLIEFLILDPQHLHGCLAHLANLSLRIGFSCRKCILLNVQLFLYLCIQQLYVWFEMLSGSKTFFHMLSPNLFWTNSAIFWRISPYILEDFVFLTPTSKYANLSHP